MNIRLFPIIAAAMISCHIAAAPPDATPAPPAKLQMKFQAYDGNVKKTPSMYFQINTTGISVPTEFLQLGDTISGTKWKLQSFEYKTRPDPKSRTDEDVSELVIVHAVTKETKVLVLNTTVDVITKKP